MLLLIPPAGLRLATGLIATVSVAGIIIGTAIPVALSTAFVTPARWWEGS